MPEHVKCTLGAEAAQVACQQGVVLLWEVGVCGLDVLRDGMFARPATFIQ